MARWGDPVQVKSKGLLWDWRLNEIARHGINQKQTTEGNRRQRMSIMGKMGEWQVGAAYFKTKTRLWKSMKKCRLVRWGCTGAVNCFRKRGGWLQYSGVVWKAIELTRLKDHTNKFQIFYFGNPLLRWCSLTRQTVHPIVLLWKNSGCWYMCRLLNWMRTAHTL